MHAKPDNSAHRILFVDDEKKVLDGYSRTLRKLFTVVTALGAEEALQVMDEDGPFTVIVSDIRMPKMDGIELLSRVKQAHPDTIRMVLTGYADLEMAIQVVNRGDIFRFLTKPCDPVDLIRAIHSGIGQYEMTKAAQELATISRIKEGMEGTLRAFTRLVEFRDPYTAGHMDRVAEIASLIATRLELGSDCIQGLHLAALVHDIGKVAVPAGILNKPGTLSEAEFAIIKAHPLVGAEVFDTMRTEWPIQRIILEHHERLDGSGYPHQKYDDEILMESKVLAVADVIDAITTNRPYRPTLKDDTIIQILESGKGTKLDARCVEVGIELLNQGQIIGDRPY